MTTTTELTPFFPPHIKPVRPGVYLVRRFWHGYSKWDGYVWGAVFFNIESAANTPFTCPTQNLFWCGLAKEPQREEYYA